MEGQLDRISVSFGKKLNMGNYETMDLHYSYSTDVQEGEKLNEAYDRAEKIVAERTKKLTEKILKNGDK